MDQSIQNIVLINNSRTAWPTCYFWVPWTIYYKLQILLFRKMLTILRQSKKHANFWLGVQFPLKQQQRLFHMTSTTSGGGTTRELLSWLLCNQATSSGSNVEMENCFVYVLKLHAPWNYFWVIALQNIAVPPACLTGWPFDPMWKNPIRWQCK